MRTDDRALLTDEAVALVRTWLDQAEELVPRSEASTSERLHRLVDDEAGVGFTMRFVDRVVRAERDEVAADQMASIVLGGGPLPRFLSRTDRALLRIGAALAPRMPRVVMPLARRRLRQLVGHLIVDADEQDMRHHLRRRAAEGFELNVNLLGEAVLGEAEATRRLEETIRLLAVDEIDYVSVKITGIASQLQYWDWDGSLDRICERLRTLLRVASPRNTFVNLDMEEFRDLHLTVEAFRRVLDEDEFLHTDAGIVVQAYLPDAMGVLEDLVGWATRRVDRGGSGIKVRLVKGANLAMERVDAAVHGWALAPYADKAATDANYKRCLDFMLRPEHTRAVRIGVASHNLFDLAWATLVARRRGVDDRVGLEMLEGMAPGQARAIHSSGRSLLLYTPVVRPADFDVAIAYLFRRLEENAATGNFLHVVGRLRTDPSAFADQESRFRASVAERGDVPTGTNRSLDRSAPVAPVGLGPFANDPESDPAVPGTRRWARAAVAARPAPARSPEVDTVHGVDAAVARARTAQAEWAQRAPAERRRILRRVADELTARRGELLTALVHEGVKTVGQADPELCEAVDFTRYYADRAEELVSPAARFDPLGVVAVIPPWNFPLAIPTGGMMAALAAGNAVICKPAPEVPRCSELVVEAAHAASVPTGLLQVIRVPENDVGRRLVTSVDAVILTGSIETARLFHSWKPDLTLFAETSGKNSVVITPSADLDLAVRDLVASAFGHAGQKCSAASLAIGVGGVLDSPRFRRQLVDAVESLAVGAPDDLGTSVGPIIGSPNPRLERALTTLEPGEEWLVEPRHLGGHLWRPGVRIGVEPGSWFHQTECFGPVLGLIAARDLDEAVAIQNGTDFGLTGGIHSLDPDEIARWTATVEVGNAYVNRPITGAIVRRQPFGGWKRSVVGPGAKAGGPGYVAQLGRWTPTGPLVESEWRAADRDAWDRHYSRDHDPSGLFCESNILRYRPERAVGLTGAEVEPVAANRVRHAAATAGVTVIEAAAGETAALYIGRLGRAGATRVRCLAAPDPELRQAAAAAGIHLADDPVTDDGMLELRHLVREQSISTTTHRFGNLIR